MTNFVSAREAKRGFGKLLDRAANGERFVITRWGRPVAELRRFNEAVAQAESDAAWASLLAHLREGVHLGGEIFDRDSLHDF